MPPKKLRQTRLANVNSYIKVSSTRQASASIAPAPVKQKSLAECGFAPQTGASRQPGVEEPGYLLRSNKRRKLPSSFEVQETQLDKPIEPPGLEGEPQKDGDDGNGNQEDEEDGEAIDEPRPIEEFSPHFLASPANDSDSILAMSASISKRQLPEEIAVSQSPESKKRRDQNIVNSSRRTSPKVVSFAHAQADRPSQSVSETAPYSTESQTYRKQVPSSQEWENEDTQSKILSTQASSQGDAQMESIANQDKIALSGDYSTTNQSECISASTQKPICLGIRDGKNKIRSPQSEKVLGARQSDSEVEENESQPTKLEAVHAKPTLSSSPSLDNGVFELDEGDADLDLDGFEFKPVRTQQLPSSLLVPQPSARDILAESLSNSPTHHEDSGATLNNEEHGINASEFSQLLPETLMETFPMPPPLSQPDSYDSGSGTE